MLFLFAAELPEGASPATYDLALEEAFAIAARCHGEASTGQRLDLTLRSYPLAPLQAGMELNTPEAARLLGTVNSTGLLDNRLWLLCSGDEAMIASGSGYLHCHGSGGPERAARAALDFLWAAGVETASGAESVHRFRELGRLSIPSSSSVLAGASLVLLRVSSVFEEGQVGVEPAGGASGSQKGREMSSPVGLAFAVELQPGDHVLGQATQPGAISGAGVGLSAPLPYGPYAEMAEELMNAFLVSSPAFQAVGRRASQDLVMSLRPRPEKPEKSGSPDSPEKAGSSGASRRSGNPGSSAEADSRASAEPVAPSADGSVSQESSAPFTLPATSSPGLEKQTSALLQNLPPTAQAVASTGYYPATAEIRFPADAAIQPIPETAFRTQVEAGRAPALRMRRVDSRATREGLDLGLPSGKHAPAPQFSLHSYTNITLRSQRQIENVDYTSPTILSTPDLWPLTISPYGYSGSEPLADQVAGDLTGAPWAPSPWEDAEELSALLKKGFADGLRVPEAPDYLPSSFAQGASYQRSLVWAGKMMRGAMARASAGPVSLNQALVAVSSIFGSSADGSAIDCAEEVTEAPAGEAPGGLVEDADPAQAGPEGDPQGELDLESLEPEPDNLLAAEALFTAGGGSSLGLPDTLGLRPGARMHEFESWHPGFLLYDCIQYIRDHGILL